jgi:hypothetical protein
LLQRPNSKLGRTQVPASQKNSDWVSPTTYVGKHFIFRIDPIAVKVTVCNYKPMKMAAGVETTAPVGRNCVPPATIRPPTFGWRPSRFEVLGGRALKPPEPGQRLTGSNKTTDERKETKKAITNSVEESNSRNPLTKRLLVENGPDSKSESLNENLGKV